MKLLDPLICPHKRLGFGSGSFYVICHDCQQFWVAKKSNSDFELEYRQGANVAHEWKTREER